MKTKGIMILVGIIAVLAVGGYFTWKHFIKEEDTKALPEADPADRPSWVTDIWEGGVVKPEGLPRPNPKPTVKPNNLLILSPLPVIKSQEVAKEINPSRFR